MTSNQHELKIYALEGEFIASVELKNQDSIQKKPKKVETVVILDRSGSMGNSVYKIVHSILPKFFELLSYDPESSFHLIAFESRTKLHKIKIDDLKNFKMFSAGGTQMAPAVEELHKLFTEFNDQNVKALRVLTVSDGEVWDQTETKNLGDKLAEHASKMNISVNSQAVRFFTSRAQPDTTALCSLLQLNNVEKSKLTDVGAQKHHDKIAKEMSELFINDGFNNSKILTCNEEIFYKFPWDEKVVDQLMLLPNIRNVFWLDEVPKNDQKLTINGEEVKIIVEENLTVDMFQILLNTKLDFIIDRMKILKVVNTENAKLTIEKIVEYFTRIENKMASLLPSEELNTSVIENRARAMKLKAIRMRKISTMLATIANDDHVNKLNAAQKAEYLRSIQVSSKAGKGLAKRAAKKNKKNIGASVFSFDEIVRKQILNMKSHFDEIKDIDYKNHQISFFSHATTFEGIRALIELTDDPLFHTFDANELLQILNLVGVACSGPVSDFPDASTWRVNEIFIGCYVSVADIITSIQQSGDSGFVLKAPGIEKEITNCIPVFDDPQIGLFLKKYAPSLIEFTSSIGMRRVIADVPMTFGYTIIAGIRKLMYDLNKNKTTAHVETFAQFVNSAASFIGKYYDHIEELLKEKELEKKGFFLANNGIGNMMVPLIRLFIKKEHKNIKNYLPEILRAIYSCEIWKGISKEFRGKREFDQIVKEMLHKLLSIDIEKKKIKVQESFVPEPDDKSLKFHDSYTVNKEYLDKLAQPLYYHNYMTLLPKFIEAVTIGKVEEIKNIPEMTKTSAMEAFGIDYSQNEFIFFNIFQALRYPRSSARADTKLAEMKIIDVKYRDEIIEDIKNYVRKEFKDLYEFEVKMKKHKEEEILANEIVEKMTKKENYENLIKIWKNGISHGEVNFKISDTNNIGFRLLHKKVIDMKSNIPLRAEIIKTILLGVDNDGQIVYNNGKIADIKNIKKLKKRFLAKKSISEWDEIEMKFVNRGEHKYRETKENRHGHGNKKASYWALGYNSLFDYFDGMEYEEMNKYVNIHESCCSSWNVQNAMCQKRWEKEQEKRQKLYEEEEKNKKIKLDEED
ncbi:hypothetical protein PVAND_014658 [Polypedilum vanderplanki]|uniref:VWFA domain-containing protein n=1 Tax=Polypedilum vanderplanki TaxID=319348 RepID=A0A9J6BAB7_POLVA|nr:hypothetical protein PVAND_014658 [Polypedilum vanderplanki]